MKSSVFLLISLLGMACSPVDREPVSARRTMPVRLADTTVSSPKARLDAQRADRLERIATKSRLMKASLDHLRSAASDPVTVTVTARPVKPEPAGITAPKVPGMGPSLGASVAASTAGDARCGTDGTNTAARPCAPRP